MDHPHRLDPVVVLRVVGDCQRLRVAVCDDDGLVGGGDDVAARGLLTLAATARWAGHLRRVEGDLPVEEGAGSGTLFIFHAVTLALFFQ